MVFFIFDGDRFAVSQDGEWIGAWTGENWHVNPATAWSEEVQAAAKRSI